MTRLFSASRSYTARSYSDAFESCVTTDSKRQRWREREVGGERIPWPIQHITERDRETERDTHTDGGRDRETEADTHTHKNTHMRA